MAVEQVQQRLDCRLASAEDCAVSVPAVTSSGPFPHFPDPASKPYWSQHAPYFALYRHLRGRGSKPILISAILLSILAGIPLPLIGVLFGRIINSFPPPEGRMSALLGQLLAVALAYFVVTWAWATCWGSIGEKISHDLRKSLVRKLLGQDQEYFDLCSQDVTNILTENIKIVQLGTSEKVGLWIQSVSYFLATFVIVMILNAKLAGIVLSAVLPPMCLIIYLGNRTTGVMISIMSGISEIASSQAENAIENVQTVQAFGSASVLSDNHAAILQRNVRAGIQKGICLALMLGGIFFVAYAANALAFFEGYKQQLQASNSSNGAGTVFAVVFLIMDSAFVIGQFGPLIQTFAAAGAAAEKIFSVLHHPVSNIDVYSEFGKICSPETFHAGIRLENVTFSYPSRLNFASLREINVCIEPGRITGIVGSSGSGKSTIASLLTRLYDPSAGRILVGEDDIRSYNTASFRNQVAIVSQEAVLFSGTILDNIQMGLGANAVSLSSDEILERCVTAAKEALCNFIPGLPNGVDTDVGSPGFTQLSGGQKQRICLARALVRKPSLLILDEFTSALDPLSESLVLESLKQSSLATRRTTVVIGHRLSTVRSADCIFVMQAGKVIESGSHEDLLKSEGSYAQFVEVQDFSEGKSDVSQLSDFIESDMRRSDSPNNARPYLEIQEQDAPSSEGLSKIPATPALTALQIVQKCLKYSRPERNFMFLGLFASVLSGAITMGEAVVFGHLVTSLKKNGLDSDQHSAVQFSCLMFFMLAIIAFISYSISGSAFALVSERLVARLQDRSLRSLLRQDLSWFSRRNTSPQHLMATTNVETGSLRGLSGSILGVLLSAAVSVVGGMILAHVVAWKIAIVLLPAVPVMMAAGFLRIHLVSLAEERQQSSYSDAAALASEACQQIKTVAVYGLQNQFSTRFNSAVRVQYRQGLKFIVSSNLCFSFSLSITYFVYALAYFWGAKLVRSGQFTQLQFFIVLPALLFSAQAAGQMFTFVPELTRAKRAAQSVFSLHDQQPSIITLETSEKTIRSQAVADLTTEASEKSTHIPRAGKIEFCGVDFSYSSRPDSLTLSKVDFVVPAGNFVGIVGQSGAGKSSVLALMERFYDPTDGRIFIDGEDIRNIPADKHRSRIGFVAQDSELFAGTVAFNIKLGARPGQTLSHDDIVKVCKQCSIHDFIMGLPDGYNTECGKNGSRLSGGQRQRLAVARAMIRNPDILLLDEPTSQLDALSQRDLQEAITACSRGRTVVMVTHKLASVQHADQVFVFSEGKLVEKGRHDDLIALGGVYANLTAV